MTKLRRVLFFLCLLCVYSVYCFPEPGVWEDVTFTQADEYKAFIKNVYKGTNISIKLDCTSSDTDAKLMVGWILRYTPCASEYASLRDSAERNQMLDYYYNKPRLLLFYPELNYSKVEYMKVENEIFDCDSTISLRYKQLNGTKDFTTKPHKMATKFPPITPAPSTLTTTTTAREKGTTTKAKPSPARRRREPDGETAGDNDISTPAASTVATTKIPLMYPEKIDHHNLATVWRDGSYIFLLSIRPATNVKYTAKVTVRMLGEYGYISAFEWPLLIFYGVMGLVYIVLGLVWLVMLACNWRDLLRVQYWIGGVIVLGMLEKAVFYAEYQSITNYGVSVTDGAIIFAELVSCLKRALARMLVIIVSVGFGIVKPRLGPTFHKVLFVGGLYFILASIEGCMRAVKPKGEQTKDMMLSAIPLAIVDASICWWIFSSLIQTTRQLRLRRNIVKLSLYRHFTNTLIFAVLASIVFMIWSIVQIKMKQCLTDWRELWIDEAFWHLLFSVILMVIMFLWRPSTNNQRYAFSPLLDAADDEEEDDTVMNDAFDGMKMRTKMQANGSPRHKEQNSIEDDLKWVEENIPSSVADKALPSLLDSDEEVMTAKYEMSKMQ